MSEGEVPSWVPWTNHTSISDNSHPVVARVVFQLRKVQGFHERWDVHGEAATQSLLQPVPAADRVGGRASPCLDGAVFGRLLFVGRPELDPVPLLLQEPAKILEASGVVMQNCLANCADEDSAPVLGILVDRVLRRLRRRLQPPRIVLRAASLAHARPPHCQSVKC